MNSYLLSGLIIFIYMNFWFIVSIIKKRNDVADLAWGLGFVLLSWYYFFNSFSKSELGFLVMLLVTLWGLRLASHIYKRLIRTKEDKRYAKWREDWKNTFLLRSYFQVYILQGFFLFLISLPIVKINLVQHSFSVFSIIGVIVWLIGFYFETVGDWQLRNFVSYPENKGKIMTKGLWKYSRHPNYFGEVTMWWGIFLITFFATKDIFIIISPLTISFLILFVSGIPLLEEKYKGRADFELYKKKTSVFFPLPPKK